MDPKQQSIMNSLLLEAVGKQDLPRIKMYVSKGANVNMPVSTSQTIRMDGTYTSSGTAPLYHYMYENAYSTPVSDYLFEQGVNVDVKNFKGNTPLMLAVKNGDYNRVKYFLVKGANPLSSNNDGEVVLDEARKLQSYYCSDRQNIIDALVMALDAAAPAAPEAPRKPAAAVETAKDIQTLKPIEFAPRKKTGGGFNL